MEYKIIVAHPGQQHSYKVASELKKNGMLFKYITTVYNKNTSFIMKVVKTFLSNDNLIRANRRRNELLNDEDVLQFRELGGLLEIALARFDKSRKLYNWWQRHNSDKFGVKVAKFAIKNNVDAVILYDTNAFKCFEILKTKAPTILRVMDVSAANRLYMKDIYEQDFKKCPKFSEKLKKERSFLWKEKVCQRLLSEIKDTQIFVAPSFFVKKSLIYSGIREEQIFICPYGANFSPLKTDKIVKWEGELEAVYVGNVTEMKGIFYLLEATKRIDRCRIHLTVVGSYDSQDKLLDQYKDVVTFLGRVSHDQVAEILKRSDLFVFPSLGEGLSLSVLEALACGLPCIVTENSGANDAIIEGRNGFVVKIQDVDALEEKMRWFDEHRDLIPQMSKIASQTIAQFNWNNHEKLLIKALRDSIVLCKEGLIL